MLMRNITKHAMRRYSVAINVDNYLEILAFYISVASMTFWYGSGSADPDPFSFYDANKNYYL
jgi:hypothetical protein